MRLPTQTLEYLHFVVLREMSLPNQFSKAMQNLVCFLCFQQGVAVAQLFKSVVVILDAGFRKNFYLDKGGSKRLICQLSHLAPIKFIKTRSNAWQVDSLDVILIGVAAQTPQRGPRGTKCVLNEELLLGCELVNVPLWVG